MRWSLINSFRTLWDSMAYGLSLTFDFTQFLLVLLSVWIFFSCITGRAQAPGFPGQAVTRFPGCSPSARRSSLRRILHACHKLKLQASISGSIKSNSARHLGWKGHFHDEPPPDFAD